MDLRDLDRFAATHHGIVTLSAATSRGVSRAQWYRAIAAGRIEQLHPNVGRMYGSPRTFEQHVLAAVWAAGPGALASHRPSARLWGAERADRDPIDVILPVRTRRAEPAGVVIHHPRDDQELRAYLRRGIPTTSPLRMLCDLGAVDPAGVAAALQALVTTKVVAPHAARAVLRRHARRGRHGISALRAALDDWPLADAVPDSDLELRMARLVHRFGLPAMDFHPLVEGFEVDFLVRGTKLIVECEGHAVHGLDREQFEFDRIRDAELVAAGYVTLRLTWLQVCRHPADVARRLRAAVVHWAPHLITIDAG